MREKQNKSPIYVLPRVGIDIGRVVIGDDPQDYTKSLLSKNYLEAPEVKGAISAIGDLCLSPRWDQVHLISKCSELVEQRTREWLYAHRFFERTKLDEANLHFCRAIEDKAQLAHRLYLGSFVDDRADTLSLMPLCTANRILFNPTKKPKPKDLKVMTVATNWEQVKWLLDNPQYKDI